ncbi:unnamed protein product [Amoebophrya sp. A25]|nr:unnamed protein product [Amoebophrya sp. A25]|eukprot:GSA25T00013824001.1
MKKERKWKSSFSIRSVKVKEVGLRASDQHADYFMALALLYSLSLWVSRNLIYILLSFNEGLGVGLALRLEVLSIHQDDDDVVVVVDGFDVDVRTILTTCTCTLLRLPS